MLRTSSAHPSRWILLFIKRIIYIIQMKKHYEKMCMTPLGFVFEGNILLDASIVTEDAMVSTTGQKLETYDFNDTDTFNTQWE